MAKKKENVIGSWAFLAGVVLAIVFGLLGSLNSTLTLVLVVIGLIVGLLNVTSKEAEPFLISGAVLIIASSMGGEAVGIVSALESILDALLLIFVPATIIVAIKNVFVLARR